MLGPLGVPVAVVEQPVAAAVGLDVAVVAVAVVAVAVVAVAGSCPSMLRNTRRPHLVPNSILNPHVAKAHGEKERLDVAPCTRLQQKPSPTTVPALTAKILLLRLRFLLPLHHEESSKLEQSSPPSDLRLSLVSESHEPPPATFRPSIVILFCSSRGP